MFFSTQASRLPKFEEGSTQAYNLGNVGASRRRWQRLQAGI